MHVFAKCAKCKLVLQTACLGEPSCGQQSWVGVGGV
jgi:hypothetical protein